jgi:hypothetical protein
MSWESRRKFLYALAVIVMLVAGVVFVLRDSIFPPPTCVDKKQNGYESGVDCGGVCSLRCSQEVSPLTVVWSKALQEERGVYDLVAMINNNNINNASLETGFTFTIYDVAGSVIGTIHGSTTAPLGGKFPIIVQNVPLTKAPFNIVTTLSDGPHFSVEENPITPSVKVTDRAYEVGQVPRVYARIVNTKRAEIRNLPIKVLLFDESDNVYAVGQTLVPVLDKEEVKDVVFTWNAPFRTAPTRIGVYPIFNPFDASAN